MDSKIECMGFKELQIKIPPENVDTELREAIQKEIGTSEFTYQIIHKSLDARKKHNIVWFIKVGVMSKTIKGELPSPEPDLEIPFKKRSQRVVVVGSGPAGFF